MFNSTDSRAGLINYAGRQNLIIQRGVYGGAMPMDPGMNLWNGYLEWISGMDLWNDKLNIKVGSQE